MKTGGIYIHIPFCKKRCNYCSFVSSCDLSLCDEYILSLKNEILSLDLSNKKVEKPSVNTIYLGGGTPSLLKPQHLKTIFDTFPSRFNIAADSEITSEVNPESVNKDFLDNAVALGVNRISMGLQSGDDNILKTAGRLHTKDTFLNAIAMVKSAGIKNISVDLMLGFPSQDKASVKRDIDLLYSLEIPHISVYSLNIEEGTPFYGNVTVDQDFQSDLYDLTCDTLKGLGYHRYEVSNFSFKGFESRHNKKYWNHSPYYGFGAAAHSYYGGGRYYNTSDIRAYINGDYGKTYEEITKSEEAFEAIMLRLRTSDGLNLNEYKAAYGIDLKVTRDAQLERLILAGFVTINDDIITVTDKGMYLLNSIILEITG